MSLIPPRPVLPNGTCYRLSLCRSIERRAARDWLPFRANDGDLWMDPRYVQAVETSLGSGSQFWNLVMHHGGQPVAAAFISLYAIDSLLFVQGRTKEIIQWSRRLWPDCLKFNVLFCGSPVSTGENHLRFSANGNRPAALQCLDRALVRLARANHTQVIALKEFDAEEAASMQALESLGYLRVESLPMNYLPTKYRDFDDLCAAMRSRYRNQIQRSRKKFAKAGLRVEHVQDGPTIERLFTDEVHRLYLAVLERAEVKLECLPAEFFRTLARQFPRDIHFTFAYRNERIVGFVCGLFHGEHYFNLFCGVDYAVNDESDLYFNLMFHDADYALRHGVKSLHVGQTADDFKSRMGCYTKPRYFYVKGTNRLMHWLLRTGESMLFPPVPPPPQHNIFAATR
jgi:Peptidogalycan biosysnthesis/recognition